MKYISAKAFLLGWR